MIVYECTLTSFYDDFGDGGQIIEESELFQTFEKAKHWLESKREEIVKYMTEIARPDGTIFQRPIEEFWEEGNSYIRWYPDPYIGLSADINERQVL